MPPGEGGEKIPDGLELILRIILGEADIKALASVVEGSVQGEGEASRLANGIVAGRTSATPLDGQGLGGVSVAQSVLRA